jgi:uncharacterized membrane protein
VDSLVVVLRLVHVVCGALWVGMVFLSTFFLLPAVEDAGPDGGKVVAAMQRRGLMTVIPILAIGALVSGIWLYLRASAGMPAEFGRSRMGMALGLGGLAAIVAWLLGMVVARPSMMRAMALPQSLGSSTSAEERQRVMNEVQRLRARSAASGRMTAYLLVFAVAAMAVARYL